MSINLEFAIDHILWILLIKVLINFLAWIGHYLLRNFAQSEFNINSKIEIESDSFGKSKSKLKNHELLYNKTEIELRVKKFKPHRPRLHDSCQNTKSSTHLQ